MGALLLAAAFALGAAADGEAVEREWRVRRWALFSAESGAEIAQALSAADWEERAAALDALARSGAAGGALPAALRAPLAAALDDPHPGVRAAALLALAASEGAAGDLLAPDSLPRRSAERLPAVRLALAAALEPGTGPARAETLAVLGADPDPRVAAAARAALAVSEPADGAAEAALQNLLAALDERRDEEALFDTLELLGRGCLPAALLAGLRGRYGGDDLRSQGLRALVEALGFARGAGGDAGRLAAGWVGEGPWVPRRQALLAEGARGAGEEVAAALLAVLDALAGGRAPEGGQGAAAPSPTCFELAEAVASALSPPALVRLLLARAPSPPALVPVLAALGARAEAWDPDGAGRWLDPAGDPRVRRAAVEAFAATFARTAEAGTRALLAAALADPDAAIEARAWRALAEAPDPVPAGEALVAAWRRCDPAERLARLAGLTRAHPFPAFRGEFLALGDHPDERRVAAAELLAPFRGDAEVRSTLEGWLADEIARHRAALAASAPGAGEPAERRLAALVEALGSVEPAGAAGSLEAALVHSLGRSTEVGKAAAAALGLTAAGRRRLASYLGAGVDRRIRVEAAITLCGHPGEADPAAAVEVLIAADPHAAWDLRVRLLPALGEAGTAPALAFLREMARDGDEAARIMALHTLAERSGGAEIPFLEGLARHGPDLEARRLAIRLLPVAGAAEAAAVTERLERLRAELMAGLLGPERTAEERDLLESELLAALGAAGMFPPALEPAWLWRPLAAAADELEARFRGEELPPERFRWGTELALAGHLARAGRLGPALERAGPWWRLDGRLLLELAAEAEAGREPPALGAALRRAGIVALRGEPARNERRLALARGEQLARGWAAGSWEECARLAASLRRDHGAGRFPDQVWVRLFGSRDPERGSDPRARLESAALQARAWAALAAGDLPAACGWADRAGGLCRTSRIAAAEQERLMAALAAAGRSSESGDR
ncbi:MAG: HEAT repeat domain-containing protein [Planctomycetota bacterium]